jgi:16S rRNA G527 N7-methylase RsmG
MTHPLVEQAASLFNISLSPQQAEMFDRYARELADWNERINLTAITAPVASSTSSIRSPSFRLCSPTPGCA